MIIKNINPAQSGGSEKVLLNLGNRHIRLAYNETAIFPDDDAKVYRDARSYAASGYIEIVEGPAQAAHVSPKTTPAWGALTISGVGTDGDTVTIGDVVFELDSNSSVTAGNVSVTIGASALATANNLVAAINADADVLVKAVRGLEGAAQVVYLYHKTNAVSGASVALAKDSTAVTILDDAETLEDGTYGATMATTMVTVPTPAALDVRIVTGLSSIDHLIVQVRDDSNTIISYDGPITVTGGVIYIPFTSGGAVDLVDDGTVTVIALG